MTDITHNQDDDESDPKLPTFEMAKQQRSELIAELRQGEAGEQRLADGAFTEIATVVFVALCEQIR
jgi:hypothetical protein